MSHAVVWSVLVAGLVPLAASSAVVPVATTTNVQLRVVAANLTSGNGQSYQTPGLNILKGLKPDVVALQEFNYSNNTPANFRAMVDATFGTNFVYFREPDPAYTIPNGIVSRYPFLASGSWEDADTNLNDRGFAWAQIDLPGTNDLYVVSVHLKASSGSSNESRRGAEAVQLKSLIESNFPANAWTIVAGDMNLYSETEPAIVTFNSFLSDQPVPVDLNGDTDTNQGRTERYDRVLASFSLTNTLAPVVLPSHSFSNGLVFVSTNYTPLSDVAPVQFGDSIVSGMQHMAVVKEFRIPYVVTNFVSVTPPVLVFEPPDVLRWQGVSGLTYTVWESSNLFDWIVSGSATSASSAFGFTNNPSNSAQQFYRVTWP